MVFGKWSATHFMQAEDSLGGLFHSSKPALPCVAQLSSSCVYKGGNLLQPRTVLVLCSRSFCYRSEKRTSASACITDA